MELLLNGISDLQVISGRNCHVNNLCNYNNFLAVMGQFSK